MSNTIQTGNILTGKVTAIKPFGAFVALEEGKEGLVHISQVAHAFVKDINEFLSIGDEVQVKVLSVDETSGKISLSIRETQPAPEATQENRPRRPKPKKNNMNYQDPENKEAFNPLADQLKAWMQQSDK
ncbi:S1 domain-containing post-transcriptional regulator GSP13 [Anaerophilus nitritogenes]|uniref:S1 domain-containing post-transcriptional regulator GSP13 n=1 Tax=Anaerophilus nitritogenes TaxID=2498136 RepID=UPI00101DBECF|nr:S1 domain-containing post-transcriptional regulator GSP13 [Anaerophilus nitritogenes]